MNQQLKQHITDINNGIVPKGYKKTKLGIIPSDLVLYTFEEIIEPKGLVRGPFGSALKKQFFVKTGYKVYEQKNAIYRDIKLGGYYVDENKFNELKRFEVKANDFIVSCSGTIGRIYKIPPNFKKGIINQALLKITVNKKFINGDFFYYYFGWERFQEKIIDNTQGGAMKNLVGMSEFKKIKIPLPPLPEQQKIADILSTWDKALELKKQLIKQKQKQKKGLMQNLLTGKVRLKGFTEEWKEVRLGDLGKTFNGLTGKSKDDFGNGKPYIPYKNIFFNTKIDIEYFDYVQINETDNQNEVQYGDIFFTVSSETPDEVGMSSVLLDEVKELYLNSFCFGFRLHTFKILIPDFARFYLRSEVVRKGIYRLAQGSTRFNLSKNELMKLKFSLPDNKEQKAIADILISADKEIDLLNQELKTLKEQKKGLMQLLLTGKVRVKE